MSNSTQRWQRDGAFTGVFDDFYLHATRQCGRHGETAWHVNSQRNSGDTSRPRDYWIMDGSFRHVVEQRVVTPDDGFSTSLGEVVTDENDPEQRAILEAIACWTTKDEESTT